MAYCFALAIKLSSLAVILFFWPVEKDDDSGDKEVVDVKRKRSKRPKVR